MLALGFSQSFHLSIGTFPRTPYGTTAVNMYKAQGSLYTHNLEVYRRPSEASPAKIPIVNDGIL